MCCVCCVCVCVLCVGVGVCVCVICIIKKKLILFAPATEHVACPIIII